MSSDSISPWICKEKVGNTASGSSWIEFIIHSASLIETHGMSHSVQNYSRLLTS